MATKKTSKVSFQFGGQRINLTKSKTQAAVRYTPGLKSGDKQRKVGDREQIRDFELLRVRGSLDAKLDELRAQPEISVGTHVWLVDGEGDSPFIPTGYLYIEFKPGTDNELEMETIRELGLNIREIVGPDAYRVSVTPDSPNPIKCVLALQQKKFVQIAEPEFMTKPVTNAFAAPSGQFIATQWHLENTGSAIPVIDLPNSIYGAGHFRRGADAKVKEAWAWMQHTGSSNIKIAVIDTGFATEHPQLRGDGTKIRNAFNAANRTADVSPWYRAADGSWGLFSHGTSCAAVAAGAMDQKGVLGAAPNARIIPIKLDILSDDAIVKAFEHAFLNGAHIISCSLGFPKPVPLSTYVRNYITKVAREGRGGLGTPIFIAAGNANPASNNQPRAISDFAAHPDVICVSASNSLDEHSSYAFYGSNVFICAPSNGNNGVGITTATVEAGGNGMELTYTSGFGGTSSATPLTAGICALMLSVNPNLSLTQIKNILSGSAEKIGGSASYGANGHSQYLGYGRINALRAVQAAYGNQAPNNPSNTGSTTVIIAPHTGGGSSASVKKGKVSSKFLNVRSGPNTSNAKVGELSQGDVVNLLESLNGWWRIGEGQYVSADYIQVLAPSTAPASNRKGKVNSPTLNVRSGPGTAYSKVAELKLGNMVNIFQTSADGWHRIAANQWVLGKYINEV